MTNVPHHKNSKPKYKTIRIYEEDYEYIRKAAFEERKSIVKFVSEAVKLKRTKEKEQGEGE